MYEEQRSYCFPAAEAYMQGQEICPGAKASVPDLDWRLWGFGLLLVVLIRKYQEHLESC